MATKYDNVIVFGPTGDTGSAAALEASKRGAKVWLAMRDTNKTISGISSEQERDGKFTRVKADLSDPDSVKQAVQESGAKAAYVYVVHGPGGIKGAVQAMKEAGIEYVVLLSSFTVKEDADIRAIPPQEFIPYSHAQAEAALEDSGIAHTALRPASFASNAFKMSMNYSKTPIEVYTFGEGKRTTDNIVPEDIGRVGGAVLVDRPSPSFKEAIYLYGPSLMSELEMCNAVKEFHPKAVTVVQQSPEEWAERMKKVGIPPPVLDYLIKAQTSHDKAYYSGDAPKRGAANIKKYSGYEPTKFEDFVKSYGSK